jgi:6-phosphogluconate dehydrogenase
MTPGLSEEIPMQKKEIGLIGLAVMGQNLVLNMESRGFGVAVYNRSFEKTHAFLESGAAGKNISGHRDLKDFVAALESPRRVMIMVKAGHAVDAVIEGIVPLLDPGDLLADCGNSLFEDTERRATTLARENIHFMGIGVSGGEEGALHGPSIMPGGEAGDYATVEPILTAIAARVDGEPCVAHLGPGGSGHFVKMVHNGIEYGDMQLIAEAYDILCRGLGLGARELSGVFDSYNRGVLESFLIEITAEVLRKVDPDTGNPLVDMVLDQAGQKGTGRWTVASALELGVATPTIFAAVQARILSAQKEEREHASSILSGPEASIELNREEIVDAMGDALYAAKICSYAQGFELLRRASRHYQYDLSLAEVARIWRGGCIIRARFLNDVTAAFSQDPGLANLLLAPFFSQAVASRQSSLRKVVQIATTLGIPVPGLSASLAYFDSYRAARLPANLIQAQRDFFGAHTYQRTDRSGVFHSDWGPERDDKEDQE